MTENNGDSITADSLRPREGWREAIQAMQVQYGAEAPDSEWLDAELVSNEGSENPA